MPNSKPSSHPIRKIRTEIYKIDQEAFASIGGVPQSYVSRWEHGQLRMQIHHIQRYMEFANDNDLPVTFKDMVEAAASCGG